MDNAEEAFPTCAQPQQMQNAKHGTISTKEAAVHFTSIRHIAHIRRAPPTDSPEEAIQEVTGDLVRLDPQSDLASNQSWAQVVTTGNVCPLSTCAKKIASMHFPDTYAETPVP